MQTDYTKEKELITKAKDGDYADLLEYITPQVETIVDEFLKSERGIALEIPKQSLMKASEKYLITAVNKYDEILSSDKMEERTNFIKFYTWFADKGITEYTAMWEIMLSDHGGSCCCGH